MTFWNEATYSWEWHLDLEGDEEWNFDPYQI